MFYLENLTLSLGK